MNSIFFVSRQSYWPDGNKVVEIAAGGRDYANPDMLSPKFPGEGIEYIGMVEAVEAAIPIAKAWDAMLGGEVPLTIGVGYTHGFTAPFEDGYELDDVSLEELKTYAVEYDKKLPRCDCCGVILSDGKEWCTFDFPDFEFCSENCAEKFLYANEELLYEEEEDGQDN